MNKSDIASMVVDEQLNRLVEQERERLKFLPLPEFEQECPFFDNVQMLEAFLRMTVMTKISTMARLN